MRLDQILTSTYYQNNFPPGILHSVRQALKQGNDLKARMLLEQVDENSDRILVTAESHFQQGLIAKRNFNYKAALVHFIRAVELLPNDGVYLNEAGHIHNKLGNHKKSAYYYKKARASTTQLTSAKGSNQKQHHISMKVFFATDRKENKKGNTKFRFGVKRGKLKYGITKVSIPLSHKIGEIESPSLWKLQLYDNPEKHIAVLGIQTLNKFSYYKAISKKIRNSEEKSAFIFIHGYNVNFENAAKRTAQMTYDLGFKGAPVFYSWPSQGKAAKYTYDETNIKWAQRNIEKFLKDFTNKSTANNIYLIAHSMGNRALTRAYISLIKKNPSLKSKIKEIILAAPDIDAQIFKRDIAPQMTMIGKPVTLYASSKDLALKASKKIHGNPRAGDSGDGMVISHGIETIDATHVNTGFWAHSYYSTRRTVISDIFYIIKQGLRAGKRYGLTRIASPDGIYWKFKK